MTVRQPGGRRCGKACGKQWRHRFSAARSVARSCSNSSGCVAAKASRARSRARRTRTSRSPRPRAPRATRGPSGVGRGAALASAEEVTPPTPPEDRGAVAGRVTRTGEGRGRSAAARHCAHTREPSSNSVPERIFLHRSQRCQAGVTGRSLGSEAIPPESFLPRTARRGTAGVSWRARRLVHLLLACAIRRAGPADWPTRLSASTSLAGNAPAHPQAHTTGSGAASSHPGRSGRAATCNSWPKLSWWECTMLHERALAPRARTTNVISTFLANGGPIPQRAGRGPQNC